MTMSFSNWPSGKTLRDFEENVAIEVLAAAEDIFRVCGAPEDFCLQHAGSTFVFGGTNRVIWDPVRGWRVSQSHCSERFYSRWQMIGNKFAGQVA